MVDEQGEGSPTCLQETWWQNQKHQQHAAVEAEVPVAYGGGSKSAGIAWRQKQRKVLDGGGSPTPCFSARG